MVNLMQPKMPSSVKGAAKDATSGAVAVAFTASVVMAGLFLAGKARDVSKKFASSQAVQSATQPVQSLFTV